MSTLDNRRQAIEWALAKLHDGTLSIDDDGHIWRHFIMTRHGRHPCIRRRAENVGGKGYLRLTLQLPGVGLVQSMAHRVIWEFNHGPIPDELQVNHKDLDKRNNRISNLELVTGLQNIRHAIANGRKFGWSTLYNNRLWRGEPMITQEQKIEIRENRPVGKIYREISGKLGISISHTHRICSK